MARKIVIASGKGGVGKTTLTAGLGIALAQRDKSVVMIDADVGLNNLDVVMGMENRVVYDMADAMRGKCRLKQALIQEESMPNLYLLPSAHAYSSEDICAKDFREIITRLEKGFDFVLIDSPAGIDAGFHRAVCAADEAIVVTTPHISSIRDADKVLTVLSGYCLSGVNVAVNRIRGDLVADGSMMSADEIAKILRTPLVGAVPEDDGITVYSQLGRIGLGYSRSRVSFDMVADNYITGECRVFDPAMPYRGFFGRIKRMISRGAV